MKRFLLSITTCLLLMACDDTTPSVAKQAPKGESESVATSEKGWPPQAKEDVALAEDILTENLVLVLDMSGSMSERSCKSQQTKFDASLEAINRFLADVPEKTNIGFVVFENGVSKVRVPLGPNNKSNVRTILKEVRPDGGTPLGASVHDAYQLLLRQAQSQLGYGQYRMLIVTDGAASDGSLLQQNVNWISVNTPIEIFTAGFCIDEGHILNQPGKTEFVQAGNVDELVRSMAAVLVESDDFKDAAFVTPSQ